MASLKNTKAELSMEAIVITVLCLGLLIVLIMTYTSAGDAIRATLKDILRFGR